MEDFLYSFRWQDGLDILIITFVFYRLYLWLRKKRALRMIVAILALPVFYLLAQWIDLPLTAWALKNLWAVILFLVIVIFQKEIRDALGSITLPTFLLGTPGTEGMISKTFDEIVEASFRMGEKRIGGLIVLQKKDDLDEFVHGKTLLDSEVNEELLISIFQVGSPLHDGAVLIHGNRIRCATALLPVCPSPSLPKDWGTRHRAGIGITEVSDAEVIIISEERGEVLWAHQGKAEKMANREDLRNHLSVPVALSGKEGWKKKWGGHLLSDLPRKILFLFLVSLFWVFLVGIRQGETTFDIPIEYYSVPGHMKIVGEPPKEINVRLKSSQRLLSSLDVAQIRLRINLSDAHSGSNQVILSESNLNVPSGITVTHFYPRRINVQLAENPKKSGS